MEDGISEIEINKIREALENETLPSDAAKIRDYFEKLDRLVLNIAVTGESGVGKSTFINAFRGLGDEDEGSAPTGEVETTMHPTLYPHPKYRHVKVWDLPGFGKPDFRTDEYLQEVEFQRYDFFIVIASGRFRANDVLLANEIQRTGKKFYFVRTKIDINEKSAKRRRGFRMDKTLALIKQDCITGLQENGVASPTVFLISSYDPQLYDFPKLQETMQRELPKHKRRVLLLSLLNISRDVNQRKKEALKADVWKIATLSAGASLAPLPGASPRADVGSAPLQLRQARSASLYYY